MENHAHNLCFIPLKYQSTVIAEVILEHPSYLDVLNHNLRKIKPTVSWDWENEISDELINDDLINNREFKSWDEYYEFVQSLAKRYYNQRLVHLEPLRYLSVNGVAGIECLFKLPLEADVYIPKAVMVIHGTTPPEQAIEENGDININGWCAVTLNFVPV